MSRSPADWPLRLFPMVKESGAIWVGSSGRTGDAAQRKDSFAKIEALGTGALATVDMPAKHYRRLLRGLCQFGAVAGAAFARRSHPRHGGEIHILSRSQRVHGARAAALRANRGGVLGAGLSFPDTGRGTAPAADRAVRSASSCTRRGPSATRWRQCRIMPKSFARCWPTTSSVSRPIEDRQNFEDYLRVELGLTAVDGDDRHRVGL